MPKSRASERAAAARSSGSPAADVYFVLPASIARIPPRLGISGVWKSGSPAESEITSLAFTPELGGTGGDGEGGGFGDQLERAGDFHVSGPASGVSPGA